MTESIVVAIISGGLALIGTVISVNATHKKTTHELETAQAVTNTKIAELTREVREHNNFARRMPVLEERMDNVVYRLDRLEGDGK